MLDGVTSGGDCIAVVAHLPAGSIDFVRADPPYLVRHHEDAGTLASTSDPDHRRTGRTRLHSFHAEAV
jgi:DNA modification methylase